MIDGLTFFDCNAQIGRGASPATGGLDSPERLLAEMDRVGIDRALVYHAAARDVSPRIGNALLMEAIKGHPRLVPCWVVLPHHTGEFPPPDQLVAELKAAGVRAVRAFPGPHQYSLSARTCGPLLEALEKARIPLVLEHAGGGFSLGDVAGLCAAHPGLPVILTRVYWTISRDLIPILDAAPNLYIETSLYQMNEGLPHLVERYGAGRILFGTHLPFSSAGAAVHQVLLSGLPERALSAVAGENLAALLGIPAAELAGGGAPARPLQRVPYGIIDMHGHIGPWGRAWVPGCDAEGTVAAMDRSGIAVLCATSMWALHGDFRQGNDDIAAAARRFPRRIIPYATVNPNFPAEIRPELTRCFEELGMRAIKVHPAFHGVPPGDRRYQPVWEFANEAGVLVLSHVDGTPAERDAYLRIAERYPRLTLILAHAGRAWKGAPEYVEAARARPNVYLEITFSSCTDGIIEYLVEQAGADRVLFGSDMVWRGPESQVGWATYARIDETARRLIMRENALRLIRTRISPDFDA